MTYPWQNLNPKDPYAIRQTSFFSNLDQEVLAALYMPIIGPIAGSLYLWFVQEAPLESEGLHSDILAHLNVGIPEFYQARVRLEGIGLLNTYRKREAGKGYLYVPCSPLTGKQFFEEELLRMLLLERVSKRRYELLRDRFTWRKVEKEELEDITQSFTDVFDLSAASFAHQELEVLNEPDHKQLLGAHEGAAPKLTAPAFDFQLLGQLLQREFVKMETLDEQAKHIIRVLHTLYGLDELAISNYLIQAADLETGKVDWKQVEELAAEQEGKGRERRLALPDRITQEIERSEAEQDARVLELEKAGYKSQEIKLIQLSEQMNPIDFIRDIKEQKNGSVTANEKRLLTDLLKTGILPPAVINMLVYYMLIIQNHPTVNKGLAETIANDWAQSGVTKPEQAIEKTKQVIGRIKAGAQKRQERRSTAKNYGKTTVRKVEKLPDWAKEEQPKKEDDLLPDEVQREFTERLKRFREGKKAGDE